MTSADEPTLFSVDQLVEREPALAPGGIRYDLFHRDANGLEASGAIVYRGRRILIDRKQYMAWMVRRGRKSPAA